MRRRSLFAFSVNSELRVPSNGRASASHADDVPGVVVSRGLPAGVDRFPIDFNYHSTVTRHTLN